MWSRPKPKRALEEEDESGAGRRRPPKALIVSLVVVLGVLLAIGGLLGTYAWRVSDSFNSNIRRGATLPPETGRPTVPTPQQGANAPVNFVLIGADKEEGGASRSDSLMVLHLTADRRNAYLVSFNRDMWVDIPGNGKNRINAAYSFGGTALTIQTLEQLLDTRMDHVAIIDFEGFIELTRQLDGVTIDNDYAFSAQGFDYPKGPITIQGKEALVFVRSRKELPRGDFDRAKNQRKVIRAILDEALSPQLIADPVRFPEFVSKFAQVMTVDDDMTQERVQQLAFSMRMTGSGLVTLQAPIAADATINGAQVLLPNEAQLNELATAMRQDTMNLYVERYGTE